MNIHRWNTNGLRMDFQRMNDANFKNYILSQVSGKKSWILVDRIAKGVPFFRNVINKT
jgi:hypothetical protein